MKKLELFLENTPNWVLVTGFFAAIAVTAFVLGSAGLLDATATLFGK